MRRILSVISGNIESGGVETYLKNAYDNVCFDDIEIDLFIPGKIVYDPYAKYFCDLGCKLMTQNIPQDSWIRYLKLFYSFDKILKKKKYDLVHVNTGNLTIQAIALFVAQKNGVPERVAHSHGTLYTSGPIKEYIRNLLRHIVNKYATKKMACSYTAGESLFGRKRIADITIARNGIKVDQYKYDLKVRKQIREKFGWENSFIIGSVGRLAPEKNYSFVIDLFSHLLNKHENSLLVLVGDGDEKEILKQRTRDLHIQGKVCFLGTRNDVPELMQGMDVFILASKREALGIVNIEAQASGLPCVVSDAVPGEVNLTGDIVFLSLDTSIYTWVKTILSKKDNLRNDNTKQIKLSGYDYHDAYNIINKMYHDTSI